MEIGDLVEVIWDDASFIEEDSSPSEWHDTLLVHTVGFLSRMDMRDGIPVRLYISSERFPDFPENFRSTTRVPHSLVRKVTVLRHGRET
jgi:hypothetical protein